MRTAKLVLGSVLVLGALACIVLLAFFVVWNSVAGPWIGGASFGSLIVLFALGALLFVAGVLVLVNALKKQPNT
ncbi:hypothetical protein D3C83_209080 [compost metagenome]